MDFNLGKAPFLSKATAVSQADDRDRIIRPDSLNEVRVEDLIETLNCARLAMVAPLGIAIALVPAFWATPGSVRADMLSALIATLALAISGAARFALPFVGTKAFERIGRGATVASALVLGSSLGGVPLVLFDAAGAAERLVTLAAFFAAMLDTLLLGPIRTVGVAFMVPLLAGGILGFSAGSDRASWITEAFILLVAGLIFVARSRLRDGARRRAVDRIARADRDQTIDALLYAVEDGASDFLWELDAARTFRNVSTRLAQAARLPVEKLEGLDVAKLFDTARVTDALRKGKPFRNELVDLKSVESPIWWRITGRPVHDHDGLFVAYRGLATDVTEARTAEIRTHHLATFDSLTDLANRVQFQTHAALECAAAASDGRWRALLYLDLDGFKGVNDRFAHAAGDAVLQEVARRLQGCVPRAALIARLGGDEFAIWYPATTPTKAEALADAIIKAVSVPFEVHGTQVELSVSIGIAFTPKHGVEPVALLGKADLALYQAKAAGKGRWRIFIDAYETSLIERRKLLDDLKLAVARQEFELFYQPLVDLSRGRISTFEALIRWRSPTRGLVMPAAFIPIAEHSNLIVAIGQWVLFQACKEAARWPDDIGVAVNVSPQQFRAPDFAQTVMVALLRSGLAPNRLELEVTESVFLDKSDAAMTTLRTLRDKGVLIALDDFGTGYSSLSYLIDFPVDKIKIDQCFVRDCATRRENQAIIDAILAIAKKLAIRVTAEGVETAEQVIALKTRRCDEIQGYLISNPRPVSDVPDMIASIPAAFRENVPMAFESTLALALAMKRQAT